MQESKVCAIARKSYNHAGCTLYAEGVTIKQLKRITMAGIIFSFVTTHVVGQEQKPSNLSELLKQMAVNGQAQQHSRDAQQLNLCLYFAGMAGNSVLQKELSDKMAMSVSLAGMSEEEAKSQAWMSMQMAIGMVEGYRQGYEDRLIEAGDNLSMSMTLEEFAIAASRSLYKNHSCEQWGNL